MDDDVLSLRRDLSSNIKKYRKILGVSQEKLAELADISTNMIHEIEGCRTWVSDKTIVKLSHTFGVDASQLLSPSTNTTSGSFQIKDILAELNALLRKYSGC